MSLVLHETLKIPWYSSVLSVSGTLRTNLDPFGLHDDAKLWDALKRSYLVENASSKHGSMQGPRPETEEDVSADAPTSVERFTLDSVVEDEGGNLSIGQVSHFLSHSWTMNLTKF